MVWTRLTAGLDREQTTALDALLAERADERVSVLAWLRHAPQAARPGQIGAVFDRLERVRSVGIDRTRRDLISRRRFEALAEEARRVPVQRLAGRYGVLRRRALLIAATIDLEETLTDHGLDLMGRFLGNLFNRSDHAHAAGMQSRGKTIAAQLRMHVALVETIAAAKAQGADADALARIVDAQHHHPLAAQFGKSVVASSDGQHFRAGGHGEARDLVNAKYGRDPGAAIYTHITGRYGPFHSSLIPPTAGEAAHVLGGLLDHRCDLAIETQHMDTGGVSDHLFAMGGMLGYRIAPRIRTLKDRRLYSIANPASYPALAPIIESRVKMALLKKRMA